MAPYDRAIAPDQVIGADGRLLAGVGTVHSGRFLRARSVHPTAGTWAGVYRSTEPINFRRFTGEPGQVIHYTAVDEALPTSSDGIILEDLIRKIQEMEDTVLLSPNPGRRRSSRF